MGTNYENKGAMTATIVVAASDSLNQAAANYICDGTSDEDEINQAINALPSGGGTVKLLDGQYNIDGSIIPLSNTNLEGNGSGTVIRLINNLPDPGADWGMIQATGVVKTHIRVANLTLDGNRANQGAFQLHGIYYSSVSYWLVESVVLRDILIHSIKPYSACPYGLATNNIFRNVGMAIYLDNNSNHCVFANNTIDGADYGILVDNCTDFLIANNAIDVSGQDSYSGPAIEISRGSGRGLIIGNSLEGPVGTVHGIYINAATANSFDISIIGNIIAHFVYGIAVNAAAGFECSRNLIQGNYIYYSQQHGIALLGTGNGTNWNLIEGNYLVLNSQQSADTYDHIYLASTAHFNSILNNYCYGDRTRYGINISSGYRNVVKNNDLLDAGTTNNFNNAGTYTHVQGNRGTVIIDDRIYAKVRNTSGGALAVGDVVALKDVAAGDEVTTPTAIGDDDVYGMVIEVINNNAYGLVQVKGKTTLLNATNAGGNIAIGDKLCAEIGLRARLAAAGDQAFARALEACAAANAVIDAYIVSPWD